MLMMESGGIDAHQVDLDADYEPHCRPRSCTWPLPCPEEENRALPVASVKVEPRNVPACRSGGAPTEFKHPAGAPAPIAAAPTCMSGAALDVAGQLRKSKSSRRNAWGNQSYADLITRAIESTPEKRLTLSQIYDWMVRFVPYFKDKGDSNSSAGWKNSIRHNLSLHTRFIRVQNEGTGKSSWWMLNPEGGKMGKGPRRRAVSMDNGTKYLKSRGRVSRKRAGAVGMARELGAPGIQGSPEHGSPAGKGAMGVGGEEFDAWIDLHSRTSSSTSTLSGCLSPILAEAEPDEPEEGGLSSSTSPRLYPSPTSTRSPALGTGGHCPSVELPHLADLTGAISLEEGYSQPLPLKRNGYQYGPGTKAETSYCGTVYGQPSMGMLRHHTPMQTIQENKPSTFQRALRAYSENNALESLLAEGPQYCGKDMVLGQGGASHSLMSQSNSAVHSHSQNHSQTHNHNHEQGNNHNPNQSLHNGHGVNHEQNPSDHLNPSQAHNKHHPGLDYSHGHKHHHSLDYIQSHDHKINASPNPNHMHNQMQHNNSRQPDLSPRVNNYILHPYNHKSSNLYGPRTHLPSTALPPNPAIVLDVPQDPCRLASAPHPRHQSYPCAPLHQGMTEPWHGYYHHPSQNPNYHGNHQANHHQDPHNRLQSDLEMDVHQSSLDCDVESILLNDFMDSTEGMDFNFDGTLSQGVGFGMGLGMGMGMGTFAGPQQSHNSQSWVPG
ncbi:forkhead box protein O6-like isoform X2 [Myxocyprinus asiaticus]|uniref:forkhead box protein O6-like isoform X2 n=1 Tax=Myxocyprinus asiaticus TaxID=70543 RepID=UPI0022220471|nr:forkhead box protein O6-like isoform X2 [Myxocyprinus asiaticus]